MVRVIFIQRRTSAGLKLTKLLDIDDFSVAKDSGKVLIIIIYFYFIIVTTLGTFNLIRRKFRGLLFCCCCCCCCCWPRLCVT